MLPVASRRVTGQSIVPLAVMNERAAGLGNCGIEEVGADRGDRVDSEYQHQQRGHQRAAADAGHANQSADNKARQDERGDP